ncbi:hypothetical protein H0H93_004165 [Arthromyces matolae]|nr:hypothetical protein H0H93_004165 [Arthromyces matolae]
MATSLVIIDDTDPLLVYSADFIASTQNISNDATNGLLYNASQHFTKKSNGNLTFKFSGTSLSLFGTNTQVLIPGTNNTYDPQWECYLDGESVQTSMGTTDPGNNFELCSANSLGDGPHTLMVNVIQNTNMFSVDYILYSPSKADKGDTLNNMWVGADDPGFSYGGNWTTGFDRTQLTDVVGSSVSYTFNGTQLSWFGSYPHDFGRQATTCSYTIDDQAPISINLQGFPPTNNDSFSNQMLFTTTPLSAGIHTVNVTYNHEPTTDARQSPLSITYVTVSKAVVGSPNSPSSSGAVSSPRPTTDSSNPSTSAHNRHIGVIVGGVVGGLLSLLALLILILYGRRQRWGKQFRLSKYWTTFFERSPGSKSSLEPVPIVVMTTKTVTTDYDIWEQRSLVPKAAQVSLDFTASYPPSVSTSVDGHRG